MSTQNTITTVVDPMVSAFVGKETFLSSFRTSPRNSLTFAIIRENIAADSLSPLSRPRQHQADSSWLPGRASSYTAPTPKGDSSVCQEPSNGSRYEQAISQD